MLAEIIQFFGSNLGENTLGAILLASFFTMLGIFVKGYLQNHGTISVAKINANVSLGEQALHVMTMAMEALRDENSSLKASLSRVESHMDQIIDLIILLMKAPNQVEADRVVQRLEQFLKSICRWQY